MGSIWYPDTELGRLPMSFQRQVSRTLDDEHRANLDVLGRVEQAFACAPRKAAAASVPGLSELARALVRHAVDETGRHFDFEERELFPRMREHRIDLKSLPLTTANIKGADCVLIVTDHQHVDYALLGRHARLIVDSRNAMSAVPSPKAKIVKA